MRSTARLLIEVLPQIVLGNEARHLADDRPERARVEFWMSGNGECLAGCRSLATKLDVAAALRDDLETEPAEDADNLEAREPTKPWHGSDAPR